MNRFSDYLNDTLGALGPHPHTAQRPLADLRGASALVLGLQLRDPGLDLDGQLVGLAAGSHSLPPMRS
jgi:hypothetical protein